MPVPCYPLQPLKGCLRGQPPHHYAPRRSSAFGKRWHMRYFARHGSGANTPIEALRVLLKLGRTSLGPVAHIGYFRDEFVARRKWLDDTAFADPACR